MYERRTNVDIRASLEPTTPDLREVFVRFSCELNSNLPNFIRMFSELMRRRRTVRMLTNTQILSVVQAIVTEA